MPTSDFHNLNTIVAVVAQLQPKRVLDVGCGFGKYGVLFREYLDVWFERLNPGEWELRLVGIEGWERYRNPIHDFVYSEVLIGDATKIVPTLGEFDLILIADVIEHLKHEDACALVAECFKRSPVVVISTPLEFCEQGEILGNPYEVHRSSWQREDFPPDIAVRTIRIVSCNIFIASREPLSDAVMALTDPADIVYLRSRHKLGWLGLPLSLALRFLCRVLS